MDPDSANQISDLAKLIGGGGLVAFAASVWYELRQQRTERIKSAEQTNAILGAIKDALAALLERDRMRAETPPRGQPIIPRRER